MSFNHKGLKSFLTDVEGRTNGPQKSYAPPPSDNPLSVKNQIKGTLAGSVQAVKDAPSDLKLVGGLVKEAAQDKLSKLKSALRR